MADQHVHVTVEQKRKRSGLGCGGFLVLLFLAGIAIKYWQLAAGLLGLVVASVLAAVVLTRAAANRPKKIVSRPGQYDSYLNEVAVATQFLGLTEVFRNTGGELGGQPLTGDIGLDDGKLRVIVNLFDTDEQARQAELGLRAKPEIRDAIADGRSILESRGRVLHAASGRGGIVDEARFDEVILVVDKVSVPPWRPISDRIVTIDRNPPPPPLPPPYTPGSERIAQPPVHHDGLEQLRKLGELHSAGVLTDVEFESKKADLLRRV